MKTSNRGMFRRLGWPAFAAAIVASGIGCAQPLHVRATDYQIRVHVDPATHALVGRAEIALEPIADAAVPEGEVWIAFDLNRSLDVSSVKVAGARLLRTRRSKALNVPEDADRPINYRSHVLHLMDPTDALRVMIDYHGTLEQDVASGEKPGQIHNFAVSAHIGEEGTYLEPSGHWYPTPVFENEDTVDPDLFLANWHLEADRLDDYELIASARRRADDGDRHVWSSPHPLTGLTLTGGRLDMWSRRVGDVDIRVHLRRAEDPERLAANEKVASEYIDHAAKYIETYQSLLGPFPYDQYTIVENFFSSGFAFPMMTLFGPVVMHMGDNSFRHGYLDHELVHSWWGCGVEVDPRDGNWCEALTSYCTNYFGFVLDGDAVGARKKRRDESNFLSRIKPEDDKPLGTYGLKDGVGRGIAYSKGAAVFHMIAREIGQEHFWRACRGLTREFMGRHANWGDLKRQFEESSGRDLDAFFAEWVRGSGAPTLALRDAHYDATTSSITVTIDQGDRPFSVDLPLRIDYGDRVEDVTVRISDGTQSVTLPASPGAPGPEAVELDPDYHVFRKLKRSEIMPTTATTRSAHALTVVVPPGELLEAYETVAERFKKSVREKDDGRVLTASADGSLSPHTLSAGGVLVLGAAVRHPAVQALLDRAHCPVRWTDDGFSVDGRAFNGANHAVLVTMHHPDTPDDGITVYTGNSAAALANAAILGYYGNSLLVFETGERTEVVLRRDFESRQRVPVLAVD